jgi:hypothetical protein
VVEAELVRMHQSAARRIDAGEVELHISGAGEVKADKVDSHEAALGYVNAREVSMTNSGAAAVQAGTIDVNGGVVLAVGDKINLGNTYAGLVAGREVHGEKIETLVLLGSRVEGNVRTLLDTRQALLAGLAGGLVMGVFLSMARWLFRRR